MVRRARRVAQMTGVVLLGIFFVIQGASKLVGPSAVQWQIRFVHWGYPAAFAGVIGTMEAACGIALFIPRWRRPAAGCLIAIMVGALATHLVHHEVARSFAPLVMGGLAWVCFRAAACRPSPEATER